MILLSCNPLTLSVILSLLLKFLLDREECIVRRVLLVPIHRLCVIDKSDAIVLNYELSATLAVKNALLALISDLCVRPKFLVHSTAFLVVLACGSLSGCRFPLRASDNLGGRSCCISCDPT